MMTRRSLRFEQLERRLLLAGDVKVAVSGGGLLVTGDQNPAAGVDETVQIASLGGGAYRVTGSAGTQLVYNGQTGPEFVVPGVTRDIVVDMKTGNDSVTVLMDTAHLPLPRNLTIKGGTGIDDIKVEGGEITGAMTLDGGSENNTLEVTETIVAKDVSIKTGNGNDTIKIVDGELRGKLTISAGNGENVVTIDPTTVTKNVSITTGSGPDGVWLEDVKLGLKANVTISTGAGNDKVGLVDSKIPGNISISTGNDSDGVGLVRVQTDGNITVNAGQYQTNRGDFERIGLAHVTAKHVTLDGGNSARNRNGTYGPSEIGVTGSTITGNLTVKTGHYPDGVGIGDDEGLVAEKKWIETILKPSLVYPDGTTIALNPEDIGFVDVSNGIVSINTGMYSGDPATDDTVVINKLNAKAFRLDTGPGNDDVVILGSAKATQEVTIRVGNDDDHLTLAVPLGEIPPKRLVDGGKGDDTLKNPYGLSHPLPPVLAAVFKNWEHFEDLII